MTNTDYFSARATLQAAGTQGTIYRLDRLERAGVGAVSRLPFSIKVLLESLLRNSDGRLVTRDQVIALAAWKGSDPGRRELP
ncbi:MAG: hypothetical protein ACRD11_06370, partial [Terriglobia bacterium]